MVRSDSEPTETNSRFGDVTQEHKTLHEIVAERIRNAIINGALYPGERLVEDRLAGELEVSRHPVREALRTLQTEGFVDISPRRGATVSRISTEEASELFEVLSALDGLAARLASAQRDDATIEEVEVILEKASLVLDRSEELTPDDLLTLANLNREFHELIARAGGNRQLIDSMSQLRDRLQWIGSAVNRRRPELSWAEHHDILDAISAGDSEGSERLARAHIEEARLEYLSQRTSSVTPTL